MNFERLVAKQLEAIVKQIADHLKGTYAFKGTESLHMLRVGLRRLGNALKFYNRLFAKNQVKQWRKVIFKASAKTSQARDRDVLILFLNKYVRGIKSAEQKKEIRAFIKYLKEGRQRLQSNVKEAVLLIRRTRLTNKVNSAMFLIEKGISKNNRRRVFKIAQKRIPKRVKALLAYDKDAHNPNRKKALHAMRIANKKLRYSLEDLVNTYDSKINNYIRPIVELHQSLGDIHDIDVWEETFFSYLNKNKIELSSSLASKRLLNHWWGAREKVYAKFHRKWTFLKNKSFFKRLNDYVDAPLKTNLMK